MLRGDGRKPYFMLGMNELKRIFTNRNFLRLMLINLFFGMTEALLTLRTTFLSINGMSPSQIGVIFSVTNIIGTVAPLVGGALADRYFSRYQVFLVSLFGYAAVMTFMPLSAEISIGSGILSMILMPMIQMFHPVGSAMIATSSINAACSEEERVDYSMFRIWMSIGYTAANFLYTPLISMLGINAPFYVAFLFFASIFLLRKAVRTFETAPAVSCGTVPKEAAVNKKKLNFSGIFKNYYIMVFLVINIIFSAASNCFTYLSYVLEENGVDKSHIGTVAAIKVLGEVIIMLLIPRIKQYLSLSGLQLLAGIFLSMELLLMQFAKTLPSLALVEMVGGLGNGIAFCTAGLYVRTMAPKGLEATAFSLWTMGTSLGGIILALICGQIVDRYGVLANYWFGFGLEITWVALFLLSFLFGKWVLKKKNVMPMLRAQ